jgi:hypothetical protein
MNKTAFLLLAFTTLVFTSCKKNPNDPSGGHDCSTVEVSDLTTHLIIEQTGTWCTVCGGEKNEIMAGVNHSPQVHHIAVHGGSDPFVNDRTQDFRSTLIRSSFFPTVRGTIDPTWIDNILAEAPKTQVGLSVTKEGTVLQIEAKIDILGDYVFALENGCAVFIDGQQVNTTDRKNLNIALYLLEDGLEYPQAAYGDFTHINVLRDYISERVQGDSLTAYGEEVNMGDSFCVYYEYDLGTHSYHEDIANCKIMAVIVEGSLCDLSDTAWFIHYIGSDVAEIGGL